MDFGGGLKSSDDVRIAFECGAKQITIGTIAVKNQALFLEWLKKYTAERIILGADFKDGKIAISGWQEESELELFPFLKEYVSHGVLYTICTDVSKDGLLAGSAVNIYRDIVSEFPDLNLIASGGVTTLDEVEELAGIGCYGAIIGKAIYEGNITFDDIERVMLQQ